MTKHQKDCGEFIKNRINEVCGYKELYPKCKQDHSPQDSKLCVHEDTPEDDSKDVSINSETSGFNLSEKRKKLFEVLVKDLEIKLFEPIKLIFDLIEEQDKEFIRLLKLNIGNQ